MMNPIDVSENTTTEPYSQDTIDEKEHPLTGLPVCARQRFSREQTIYLSTCTDDPNPNPNPNSQQTHASTHLYVLNLSPLCLYLNKVNASEFRVTHGHRIAFLGLKRCTSEDGKAR